MDFQHRPGGKTGSGGVASASESNRDRRERLRQLALETIDINKVSLGLCLRRKQQTWGCRPAHGCGERFRALSEQNSERFSGELWVEIKYFCFW